MGWLFEQTTGWMISQTGARLAQGYSGAGAGKNNPAYENVEDVGVIPAGTSHQRTGDPLRTDLTPCR